MRGNTSVTSTPSPPAALTEKCHSLCGVSPSLSSYLGNRVIIAATEVDINCTRRKTDRKCHDCLFVRIAQLDSHNKA